MLRMGRPEKRNRSSSKEGLTTTDFHVITEQVNTERAD